MRLIHAAAFAVLLMAGTCLYGANILVNPGFESGNIAPWVNSNDFCGGCTWAATGVDAHSGAFSAEVNGNRLILDSFTPVDVADINEVSFWARHPGAVSGADMAVYFAYSDASSEEVHVFTAGTSWEFFDVTGSLDPGKSLVAFGVYGNGGELARFDDALVDVGAGEVPEPSTFALLAAGLGAIAFRRRAVR